MVAKKCFSKEKAVISVKCLKEVKRVKDQIVLIGFGNKD